MGVHFRGAYQFACFIIGPAMERTGKNPGIAFFPAQQVTAVLAHGRHDPHTAVVSPLHQERVFVDSNGHVIARLWYRTHVTHTDPFPVPDCPLLELKPIFGGVNCRRHAKAIL